MNDFTASVPLMALGPFVMKFLPEMTLKLDFFQPIADHGPALWMCIYMNVGYLFVWRNFCVASKINVIKVMNITVCTLDAFFTEQWQCVIVGIAILYG